METAQNPTRAEKPAQKVDGKSNNTSRIRLLKLTKLRDRMRNKDSVSNEVAIDELRENVKLFRKSVEAMAKAGRWGKEHSLDIAAVLVPTALGSLSMIIESPIAAQMLTRMSLGLGFGLMGYKKYGLKGAILGGVAGGLAPEVTQFIPGEKVKKAAEISVNGLDDAQGIVAAGTVVGKKLVGK